MDKPIWKKPGLAAFINTYNSIAKLAADSAAATDDKELVAAGGRTALRVRPFPGLRSFEPDESDVFFGRKDHTDAILNLLREQQVIAVLGGSGLGKSSVVRAGVIPALTGTHKIEGRLGRWYVAVCKPGKCPIDELCDALWQQILRGSRPKQARRRLRARGPRRSGRIARAAQARCLGDESDKAELQQIFDQEIRPASGLNIGAALWFASDVLDRLDREMNSAASRRHAEPHAGDRPVRRAVRTRCRHRAARHAARPAQTGFRWVQGRDLGGLLHHYNDAQRAAASLRRISRPVGDHQRKHVPDRPDRRGVLREAIWRPARRVFDKWGLPCKDEPVAPFDPAFVDWLVAESSKLRESLVHKPDQLPLMQHALRLTWDNAVRRWSENSDQTGPLDGLQGKSPGRGIGRGRRHHAGLPEPGCQRGSSRRGEALRRAKQRRIKTGGGRTVAAHVSSSARPPR